MQRTLDHVTRWALVIGGLLWAYEGFTNTDLVMRTFGSAEQVVDIIVFGGSALYVAYRMVSRKNG